MSGPKTATLIVDPVTVLLVAAGLRAAHAVQQGYEQAAALREQHQHQRSVIESNQQQAGQQHVQNLQAEEAAARAELANLLHIATRLGLLEQVQASCPQPQDNTGFAAQSQYVQALQIWNEQVRLLLRLETARRTGDLAAMPDDELAVPLPATSAAEFAAVPVLEDGKTTARRLLERMTSLGDEFVRIPDDIRQVALALAACPPGERATLLATDLRLRIQQHIEEVTHAMAQRASGVVVQHTLSDLGYQVEEITDTLFVEGGVVHFRRVGWGDYMVRMRIQPGAAANAASAATANFNVVRAVAEANNEVSVLDHIAEDRWCTEFPALLQALAARGVQLQVTRHLQAGELPVQQVLASRLPAFADEFADEFANENAAVSGTTQTKMRSLP